MAKKILTYTVEDKTIAELLGRQNFTNENSAILELVKNAYDSGASALTIQFTGTGIIITDNGSGMNADDIEKKWMHVGKSDKGYDVEYAIDRGRKRILAGSKGIGRFALSRLGDRAILYSQKNDASPMVSWITDWATSTLETTDCIEKSGTIIELEELRDRWKEKDINALIDYLSRSYFDDLMKIVVKYTDEKGEVQSKSIGKYFVKPKVGINCLSKINLQFNPNDFTLACSVESDEFDSSAKDFCGELSLNTHKRTIKISDELDFKAVSVPREEIEGYLRGLGEFSAEFYFNNDATENHKLEFLYKHTKLPSRYESGVILYRNAFSISSFDGEKDWIGFGKRSRKSPAAATHPTGSWRVRENQIAGMVFIDKMINAQLRELSNRQGLEETIYYKLFVEIIGKGIAEFERHRQLLIRAIDVKNTPPEDAPKPIVEKIIKDPKKVLTLTENEAEMLVKEIKAFKSESAGHKKQKGETEKRYKYDVRILNVLATIGLKASSIAHEMHNDRNNIATYSDNIIEALKKYGVWNVVDAPENKKHGYSNVPQLLAQNKKANIKIASFMDTMLTQIEKRQFLVETYDVSALLDEISTTWKNEYSWVEIKLNTPPKCMFNISEDVITVIFNNLFLNSIQQNSNESKLIIEVEVLRQGDHLLFKYTDDGKGLCKKYHDEPKKILEVHESSRENGHGLGMWIVHNTVVMSSGQIGKIEVKPFSISFTIGDVYDEKN